MRKLILLVSISLMGLFLLAACVGDALRIENNPQPTATHPTSTETAVDVDEPLTITPQVNQPNPVLADQIQPESTKIACDDTFCLHPWQGWLERPIGIGDIRRIDHTYPYASRGDGTLDPHHGVEFPNGYGTPVLAAQDGEVVFAGMDDGVRVGPFRGFYGNVIVLQHPRLLLDERDVYTLYAHLSELDVQVGDRVAAGQVIGAVGATGAADGPHLHFEVRVDTNGYAHTTNPVLWFAPLDEPENQNTATLAGLILDRRGNPLSQHDLVLEKLTDEGSVEANYYPDTYYPVGLNGHPLLMENFAVSDLPAGDYRLAFISSRLYEFRFTLEAGSLGFIQVQLD